MGHDLFAGGGTTPNRRLDLIRSEIPMSTAQNKIVGAPISGGL
jgi:hypothetical protein